MLTRDTPTSVSGGRCSPERTGRGESAGGGELVDDRREVGAAG